MYRIVITDSARRFVEDADAALQRRLRRCLELLKSEPRKHPNIVRLRGPFAGHCRLLVPTL